MKKTPERRWLIYVAVYAILACTLMYLVTAGGMGVSFDSEKYLLMALYFEQGAWGTAFNTTWLPFYPMMVALGASVGIHPLVDAARLISLLCFVISVVTVFLLGRLVEGRITAHLSALFTLLMAPLIFVFSYCWSETAYIMLSLLCLLMLTLFLKGPESRRTKYLIWAAVFGGLGFFTRYLGFSLILAGLLVILLVDAHARKFRVLRRMLLFGCISGLPMLLNLLGCLFSLGSIARKTAASQFSLPETIGLLLGTLHRDFLTFDLGFRKYKFFLADSAWWPGFSLVWFWSSVVILAFLVFSAVLIVKFGLTSRSFRDLLRPGTGLAVYVAVYVVTLIGISSSIYLDPIGTRFAAPLYPFILVLVFSGIRHLGRAVAGRKGARLFFAAAAFGAILFLCAQLVSICSMHRGISSGSFPAMEHPGNRNRASLRFLQSRLNPNDLVVTNIPDKMEFIWPRDIPYLGVAGGELSPMLAQFIQQASHRAVYVLICAADYSIWQITDADQISKNTHLLPSRGVFGNDYVYQIGGGTGAWPPDRPPAR